jgi:hypothetical protein
VGCEEVCRVHGLEPVKCVAFEGTNIGESILHVLGAILVNLNQGMMLLIDRCCFLSQM